MPIGGPRRERGGLIRPTRRNRSTSTTLTGGATKVGAALTTTGLPSL